VNNDPVNFVDRTGLGGCGALVCDGVTIYGGGDNRVDPEGGTPGVVGAGSVGILLDGGEDPNGGAGEHFLSPQMEAYLMLWAVYGSAWERIRKMGKACEELFAGVNISDYLKNMSVSDKMPSGASFEGPNVNAVTTNIGPGNKTLPNLVTVFNLNSGFFSGVASLPNGETVSYDKIFKELTTEQKNQIGLGSINSFKDYQELILLHELVHAGDKKGEYQDGQNVQKSREIDRKIQEKCF
jgi:hypothetical protein